MKKFIIGFIITILFFAFSIGQCNNTIEENEPRMSSFYPNDAELKEQKEEITEPFQEKTTKKIDNEDGESNINVIVRLPKHIPSQLLSRIAYNSSYNKDTKIPNWVAWHLTAEHAGGSLKKYNSFREDEDVPRPRATLEDYKGSGWSRGHMCPAGDNKWDELAMEESFLLTNVCPQNQSLNSGVWNRIEMDCRQWARKYGEVFIVCGPVLLKREHETIGKNRVVVPEAFFKVVLCMKDKPKAIGFVIRNNEGKKKRDMFVNSVDEVERITGYDFFPALPDEVENVIEAKADIKEW